MKLSDIQKAYGGALIGTDTEFNGAAYDSREVKPGNLFVCLRGERTDGHKYLPAAQQLGAVAALCSQKTDTTLPYILVDDTEKAFISAARAYKAGTDAFTVAVTGSVGKTTTKEFIYSVLSRKYKVHKSEGNRNSSIGLPASVLDMPSDAKMCVFEMGMSAFGEISELSRTVQPNIGVITNIGFSHIEYLGSRENILKAKLEILDGMKKNGVLVVNGDDEYLSKLTPEEVGCDLVFVGLGSSKNTYSAADIYFKNGKCSFTAITPSGVFCALIPAEGIHNVYNALSAIAVGNLAGIAKEDIRIGLTDFRNAPLRQNIYDINGMTIIEDCYNASPTSVAAAADVLRHREGRKIAVLGDMLELGAAAPALHEDAGRSLVGVDVLIAFGNYNAEYIKGAVQAGILPENCHSCANTCEAAKILKKTVKKGDIILFKASRGMQAEDIIKRFV